MAARAALAIGVGTALLAGPSAVPSAKADCVYADVYVKRKNRTPMWVNQGCVGPNTPWPQRLTGTVNHEVTGAPDGAPYGIFIGYRVPVPG